MLLIGADMKNTVKITFCAIMAALASVLMILSYFPYFTYAVPAIAGLASLIVLIEINSKWAWGTYLISAFLAIFFAEPESMLMFVLFLGYYPILKSHIERIQSKTVQYLLKFAVFNAAVLLVYGLLASVFGLYMEDIQNSGKFFVIGLLALANVTFYLYDIVLVRAANFYIYRLHRQISKLLIRK